jgi:5-methylthioadenosine/S-adenosylhomocysteine deaminase
MTAPLLIKGGLVVTVDESNRVVEGDVLVRDGRIEAVGNLAGASHQETIDARGCAVMPGFVQTHIHLCQTIFRGAADDLELIDWLKKRVWPLEAAHTPESLRASAMLGIAELIRGGTTCALTMETVNHTEEVFRAVEETGFRATVGKCMMDKGAEVPTPLREDAASSIAESLALLERWHGRDDNRIRYCFAPRFAVSCTDELLREVARHARERGVMVHTHASENREEIAMVERETGRRNVHYLDQVGLTGPHVALAHCVHVDEDEIELLARTGTHVSHCPSSNLKLGSGLAPIAEMMLRGVSVSLGADGAPCNNRLDMFTEMRTAALLQKVRRGAAVLPAWRALRMATIDGARALGLGDEVGSLEPGKRADLLVLNLDGTHLSPRPDLVSSIVYAAQPADVKDVLINGRIVLRDGRLTFADETTIREQARVQYERLAEAAGLS